LIDRLEPPTAREALREGSVSAVQLSEPGSVRAPLGQRMRAWQMAVQPWRAEERRVRRPYALQPSAARL